MNSLQKFNITERTASIKHTTIETISVFIYSHDFISPPTFDTSSYTELLLPYFVEELKSNSQQPFILLIDGVRINDEHLSEYLRRGNSGCYCGIISENIVDAISGDENEFLRFTERMNCFIFFKHGTGKTATALSEIIGRYDHTKVEASQGTARGFFSFLPRDRHEDVRFSTENRYRVMPEEITGLYPGQAIVFDATIDQIIHFN